MPIANSTRKYLFVCGIIFLLICSLFAINQPVQASDLQSPVTNTFTDITPGDEDIPFINYLAGKGIINGYPDGYFHPADGLTRAQAAIVIVKAAGLSLDTSQECTFNDVEDNHWAKAYINVAANAGYVKGMPDGKFNPEGQLTRAQAISLILQLSKQPLTGANLPALTDVNSTHWAAPSIAVGLASKMVGLSADGKQYLPDSPFTRKDLAHALGVLLTQNPDLYTVTLEGKLKPVEGNITIQTAESQSEMYVKTEIIIKAGDIIKTGALSSAEINYPDGSSLLLKENTQLTIVETKGRKYIKDDGSEGIAVEWLDIRLKQGTMFGGLATEHEPTVSGKTQEINRQTYQQGSKLLASLFDWKLLLAEATHEEPWFVASEEKKVKIQVDMPWGVASIRGTFVVITASSSGESSVSCLIGNAEVSNGGVTVPLTENQSTQVKQPGQAPPPATPMSLEAGQQFAKEQSWIEKTSQTMDKNRAAKKNLSKKAPSSTLEIINKAIHVQNSKNSNNKNNNDKDKDTKSNGKGNRNSNGHSGGKGK